MERRAVPCTSGIAIGGNSSFPPRCELDRDSDRWGLARSTPTPTRSLAAIRDWAHRPLNISRSAWPWDDSDATPVTVPAMQGAESARAQAPVRTREEMLQEWREQRAVRISGKADVKLQQSSAPAPSGDAGKENHGTTRPPMASHKVTQSQPEPHSAPSRGVNSIAARLESLKRESLRPSIAPPSTSQAGIQFEAAGPVDSTALRRLAGQLFDDESWKQLYDKGMNAKLTRSRDGATEETKIKELAGMMLRG